MLNGGATPSKRSKIERETNSNVIVNVVVLVIMCTIAAIFNCLEESKTGTSSLFFDINSGATDYVLSLAKTSFPSRPTSPSPVKTIPACCISQDVDMYYESFDTACIPKTWNVSDDLGQIEYVFSDKTGTLTQNVMEFQQCSVAGIAYGEGVTEPQKGVATRQGNTDFIDRQDLAEKLAALK